MQEHDNFIWERLTEPVLISILPEKLPMAKSINIPHLQLMAAEDDRIIKALSLLSKIITSTGQEVHLSLFIII